MEMKRKGDHGLDKTRDCSWTKSSRDAGSRRWKQEGKPKVGQVGFPDEKKGGGIGESKAG